MEPAPSTGAGEGGVPYDYDAIWADVYGDMQRHGPVHRHAARLTAELLAGLSYDSVLDVGSGPGLNHDLLTRGRPGVRFTGIDIAASAVASARAALPEAQWHRADIQVSCPPGTWDLVHCGFVLEHLPDDEAALRRLREATGRHLLVATMAGDFDRYRPWEQVVGHVRNYRRGELEARLAAAGFRVERCIYWGWPFYSPLVRRLQNTGRFGTGSYTPVTRAVAAVLHAVYRLNSSRRGDVVLALAAPA